MSAVFLFNHQGKIVLIPKIYFGVACSIPVHLKTVI